MKHIRVTTYRRGEWPMEEIMTKNIRLEKRKYGTIILYVENGVEKETELISVSLFPEKFPEEVQSFYEKYQDSETEESISAPKSETPAETITGVWKLGPNFQSEMENGYNPTVEILWEEMGVRPYNFNERFEEISNHNIHDCLSELEDGLECPIYHETVEKMRSEFREIFIDFSDCKYLHSGKHLVWNVDPEQARGFVEVEGLKIVNTTPHDITLLSEKTGREYQVKPCGFILNATPEEKIVSLGDERGEVSLVQTVFKPSEEGLKFIEGLFFGSESTGGKILDKVIIGSIIAAQAYPGKVVAMTPAPGFERVPPAEKKMNLFKYTVF